MLYSKKYCGKVTSFCRMNLRDVKKLNLAYILYCSNSEGQHAGGPFCPLTSLPFCWFDWYFQNSFQYGMAVACSCSSPCKAYCWCAIKKSKLVSSSWEFDERSHFFTGTCSWVIFQHHLVNRLAIVWLISKHLQVRSSWKEVPTEEIQLNRKQFSFLCFL